MQEATRNAIAEAVETLNASDTVPSAAELRQAVEQAVSVHGGNVEQAVRHVEANVTHWLPSPSAS